MSSRTTRASSAQPSYMSPTIASNARTRRAASAQPSSPTPMRMTRSRSRSESVQPAAPPVTMSKSSKPAKRAAKAPSKSRAPSSRAGSDQVDEASSSSTANGSARQVGVAPKLPSPARELQRSGYGCAHASREDEMGVTMAKEAQKKGLIDDETAQNWSHRWHTKGVLESNWSRETIDKFNRENGVEPEEVMDLKEAEAIQKKKDAAEKKWLEDWEAGRIDENGVALVSNVHELYNKSPRSWFQQEREFDKQISEKMSRGKAEVAKTKEASIEKEPEKVKKAKDAKATLKKVVGSKVSKPVTRAKKPQLPTIAEASSPAASFAKPIAKSKAKTTTTKKSSPEADNANALVPLPGLPDYTGYQYYQLIAICKQRNIKSGGSAFEVRNRLIQDDINVTQSLPREAKNYNTKRDHVHNAPVVPNAPVAPPAVLHRATANNKGVKRTLQDDDDTDDDDDNSDDKPKGKKAKTA